MSATNESDISIVNHGDDDVGTFNLIEPNADTQRVWNI